jgi:type I restriction enzyme, R subunit
VIASPNFGFLAAQDPQLVRLGAQAERYFRDDPSTALFKIRQFAEFLAKLVAAHHGEYGGERETFEELLRRLSLDRILPRETADVFHQLRRLGNVLCMRLLAAMARRSAR